MLKNADMAEAIRLTAYFLWEQDGRPEGRSFDYWLKAKAIHQRQMAFDQLLANDPPEALSAHEKQT